jgi:phosphoribosylamine-glycine ligase
VKQVRIANALAHDAHILDSGVTVKGGDTILPLHSTSDRAGFLVATGETLEEAAAHADRGCREVSTEYADGSIRHAAELIEFRELAHS